VRLYRLERGQEQQNVTEKHADSQWSRCRSAPN
jgi:hypothetical protein